jgi:ribosome-associated protein
MQRQAAINRLPDTVKTVIDAARDRKATDLVVLDLRRAHGFTDYFVICSGTNPRQIKAIADAIDMALKALKIRPNHIEGYDRAEWVLIDCFDFIVHIFNPETRTFYALERLWGNADRIDVDTPEPPADSARR